MISLCISSLLALLVQAGNPEIEMADGFRAEGKIYVLVAIMLTILIGLIFFLIRIERKVAKLEKEIPPKG
jgi:hypothetical protein